MNEPDIRKALDSLHSDMRDKDEELLLHALSCNFITIDSLQEESESGRAYCQHNPDGSRLFIYLGFPILSISFVRYIKHGPKPYLEVEYEIFRHPLTHLTGR